MKKTLSSKQIEFSQAVGYLLLFAKSRSISIKITCLYRTPEQQRYLVKSGKSKTLDSYHLSGLAVDIAIIKDGKAVWSKEAFEPLGRFWADELGGTWGGDFKNFEDCPHFQWKDNMRLDRYTDFTEVKPEIVSFNIGGEKEEDDGQTNL